jgi:hypothetical protein
MSGLCCLGQHAETPLASLTRRGSLVQIQHRPLRKFLQRAVFCGIRKTVGQSVPAFLLQPYCNPLWGLRGDDVIYGGDGNDFLSEQDWDKQRDKLYCGEGRDYYLADKNDYVDSSCEKKAKLGPPLP